MVVRFPQPPASWEASPITAKDPMSKPEVLFLAAAIKVGQP